MTDRQKQVIAEINKIEADLDRYQEKVALERAIKEKKEAIEALYDEARGIHREWLILVNRYYELTGRTVLL